MPAPRVRSAMALLPLAVLVYSACSDSSIPAAPSSVVSADLAADEGPIPITACGTVITRPGTYVFAADLLNCSGTALAIWASHVTVISRAHGIEGASICISAGVGVRGGISDLRLDGVDARNCGVGILFENVRSSLVQSATVWWNGTAGIQITERAGLSRGDTIAGSSFLDNEIVVTSGSGIVIRDNLIEANLSSVCGGIRLVNGTGSEIRNNTMTTNCVGIEVSGQAHTIADNTLTGGQTGIRVAGQRNLASGNSIRNMSFSGMEDHGAYNTFSTNTVEAGGWGIIAWGHHGAIDRNTVQDNGAPGMDISANYMRVSRNSVLNNFDWGIRVNGGHNAIGNNIALNNSGYDLWDVPECGTNNWHGNQFGTATVPCIH